VLASTITVAAERIGRSVDTLNHWSKVGLLPVTPLRSPRGDRLYTDGMILVMKMAIMKRGQVSVKDQTFRAEIVSGWRELGVEI
jgi:DNA-binding transcriptional MerR regulator